MRAANNKAAKDEADKSSPRVDARRIWHYLGMVNCRTFNIEPMIESLIESSPQASQWFIGNCEEDCLDKTVLVGEFYEFMVKWFYSEIDSVKIPAGRLEDIPTAPGGTGRDPAYKVIPGFESYGGWMIQNYYMATIRILKKIVFDHLCRHRKPISVRIRDNDMLGGLIVQYLLRSSPLLNGLFLFDQRLTVDFEINYGHYEESNIVCPSFYVIPMLLHDTGCTREYCWMRNGESFDTVGLYRERTTIPDYVQMLKNSKSRCDYKLFSMDLKEPLSVFLLTQCANPTGWDVLDKYVQSAEIVLPTHFVFYRWIRKGCCFLPGNMSLDLYKKFCSFKKVRVSSELLEMVIGTTGKRSTKFTWGNVMYNFRSLISRDGEYRLFHNAFGAVGESVLLNGLKNAYEHRILMNETLDDICDVSTYGSGEFEHSRPEGWRPKSVVLDWLTFAFKILKVLVPVGALSTLCYSLYKRRLPNLRPNGVWSKRLCIMGCVAMFGYVFKLIMQYVVPIIYSREKVNPLKSEKLVTHDLVQYGVSHPKVFLDTPAVLQSQIVLPDKSPKLFQDSDPDSIDLDLVMKNWTMEGMPHEVFDGSSIKIKPLMTRTPTSPYQIEPANCFRFKAFQLDKDCQHIVQENFIRYYGCPFGLMPAHSKYNTDSMLSRVTKVDRRDVQMFRPYEIPNLRQIVPNDDLSFGPMDDVELLQIQYLEHLKKDGNMPGFKAIERLMEQGYVDEIPSTTKVFMKWNEMLIRFSLKDGKLFPEVKPRPIHNVPREFLASYGSFIYEAQLRFKKMADGNHSIVIPTGHRKGKKLSFHYAAENMTSLGNSLNRFFDDDSMDMLIYILGDDSYFIEKLPRFAMDDPKLPKYQVVCMDYSSYDATQGKSALKIEYAFLEEFLKVPKVVTQALYKLAQNVLLVSHGKGDESERLYKLDIGSHRDTGGADTSLGNSIVNLAAWYTTLCNLDCCYMSQDILEENFKRLGLIITMKSYSIYEDRAMSEPIPGDFLRGIFIRDLDSVVRWTPLPSPLIKVGKLGTPDIFKMYRKKQLEKMYPGIPLDKAACINNLRECASTLYQYRSLPIFRAFVTRWYSQKFVRIARMFRNYSDTDLRGEEDVNLLFDTDRVLMSWKRHYGIELEIANLESYFLSAPIYTVLMDPIWLILAQDYTETEVKDHPEIFGEPATSGRYVS
jgi:hypothetical protein